MKSMELINEGQLLIIILVIEDYRKILLLTTWRKSAP